jgi:flagellar biosynthesis protein
MTEKRRKATALTYDQKKSVAPMITATGKGLVANEIIKKAKANEVPILEDASLVELLSELNINETIPEELYQAVAEIFSFVYHADKQLKRKD